MEDWLSPMNRVKFQRAFRDNAAQVVLRENRKFDLTYSKQRLYGEECDVVFISPAGEGFVPCGYFRMEKVLDQLWLFETEKQEGAPGLYDQVIDKFLNGEHQGVNVLEEYKELQGKNYQTVRRGLVLAKAARGKEADQVGVITDDGVVFLVKGAAGD